MINKKHILFALIAFTGSLMSLIVLLISADLFILYRQGDLAVYNYRGYRGVPMGKKTSNEIRIVTLGGSTTLGYGVKQNGTWPCFLEKRLNKYFKPKGQTIKIANLAYNNEGAYAYVHNLKDFKYLDYDIAIFYSGYNDLGGNNTTLYRQSSPVFRTFGYMPVLPTYLKDRVTDILTGGEGQEAAWGVKTTFKPNILQKTHAEALKLGLNVYQSLENQLQRFAELKREEVIQGKDPWHFYKYNVKKAVDLVLSMKKKAVFVTQPNMRGSNVGQQTSLKKEIFDKYYIENKSFYYVNLLNAVDLKNTELSFDSMHLTPRGNAVIAQKLLQTIANMISELTGVSPENIKEMNEDDYHLINNETTITYVPSRGSFKPK